MNDVEKLLYLYGIAADYYTHSGEKRIVPEEDRLKILAAMGFNDLNGSAVQQRIFELDAQPWTSWLQRTQIVPDNSDAYLDIKVSPTETNQLFAYRIVLTSGSVLSGEFVPGNLDEVGDYYIDGSRYSARRLWLEMLPIGYHQLVLSSGEQQQTAELIVCPARCYQQANDDAAEDSRRSRSWGVSCQLYTLRSEANWGIGDFSDLLALITASASVGADVIGLNPLHMPLLSGSDYASPYSPSDRRFLNPLYIDVQQSPDFHEDKSTVSLFQSNTFQHRLKQVRNADFVDYEAVLALKFPMFEAMFKQFEREHLHAVSSRTAEFIDFLEQQGQTLEAFADFEAGQYTTVPANDSRFHQYLQWQAREQLQQCQQAALASGMTIGLMGDLAVGAISIGAEVSNNPDLFSVEASIGAPPDPFSSTGQNWNMPAINPLMLREQGYRHFIELLRANMSGYGALRIDHVLGLLRLWWCLPGLNDGGAYVYYPFSDLLAILRLESHLQQCVIIGEDMGVVPDELREGMSASGVYANKALYFETQADGSFTPPSAHMEEALLMVTNHDVATLAGWWNTSDLNLHAELGKLNEHELADSLRGRRQAKLALLRWLQEQSVLPEQWQENSLKDFSQRTAQDFDQSLCKAILRASARSRSELLLVQIDDLDFMHTPVNIPGTHREYPNWRRKLKSNSAELIARPGINELMQAMNSERF